MDEASVASYIASTFDGVHAVGAWGDTFFFYNPDRRQEDKVYFATIKNADDEYDNVSDLSRPSVFRLNVGVGKATYRSLLGREPPRPEPDGPADTGHDFTALDQILPHPVYARAHWICVLNPSAETFETLRPLLAEAYDLAVARYAKLQTREQVSTPDEADT